MLEHTLELIESRRAVVGVIGMGYVGLPLAVAFAQAGFHVVGIDVDQRRVAELNDGISPTPDVDSKRLKSLVESGLLRVTDAYSALADVDTVSICVPTPLRKTRDPDVSYVINAAEQIAQHLQRGQLVVLESTTYPGTTDELLRPMLEATGLTVGTDVFLAFSPERIDPGNQTYSLHNTPKVVGGVTSACSRLTAALYGHITEQVVPVASPMVAEMVKLLENTFRAVNIGLANELAQMANVLGVDVWEVINAAATKPFGFVPFYPGPGIGGHCIPVDPHYLAWKLRTLNYRARFIELASEINGEMPRFVVSQIAEALNEHGKCLNGSHLVVLGVAYKRDIGDVRESPALDVITLLRERHANIAYVDKYVSSLAVSGETLHASAMSDDLIREADCVVIITDHSDVDYAAIVRAASLVVDTRNSTEKLPRSQNVWRLTRPLPIVD